MLSTDTVDGERAAGPAVDPELTQGTLVDDERAGDGAVGGLRTGSKLGRYVLRRRLGAGAMGVVFEAHDPDLDRRLAIKVLRVRGGDAQRRAIARTRLIREAQALARVDHPNVISVHDVGRHLGSVYVVMEYVDGRTLQGWLDDTDPKPTEILEVFCAAGRGLAAAHRVGIVHRDFKPENVMVDLAKRVKVLDFGLARPRGETPLSKSTETSGDDGGVTIGDIPFTSSTGGHAVPSESELGYALSTDRHRLPSGSGEATDASASGDTRLTRDGALLGTPAYMSPEQHLGEAVDAASDQFSFCVALYEALYGEPPFAGKTLATRALQVIQGKVREPGPDGGVPRRIREILMRGLEVEPAARFPSMDALIAALEHDPARRRRRRLTLAGGALGLTGVAAVGGVLLAGVAARERCAHTGALPGWNDARSQAVGDALGALDVPFAAQTARKVPGLLDDYASRWEEMRNDACLATHVRDEQSAALLDLRMACLDERARTFETLVAELEHADVETAENAVAAALHLPRLEACADTSQLLDRERRNEALTPERRATLRALTQRVETTRVRYELGRYDEALALVEPLQKDVVALRDPGLEARVRLLHGQVLEAAGRHAGAERELLDAARAAERARDVATLGHIRSMLVSVIGDRLARPAEGRIWADFARTSFETAKVDARHLAVLDHRLGFVAEHERKLDEQAALQKAALERYGALEDPDPIVLATMHKDVAGVMGDLGKHDQARAHAEEALEIWREHLGTEHPKTIIAAGTLGLLADMRGDYEEARARLTDAERRIIVALGPEHPHVATISENLAITLANLGELEAAETRFRRVVEIEENIYGPDHPNMVGALSNLGSILRMRDKSEDALAVNERLLGAVMRREDASDGERKNAYAGLARSYYDLGRYEDALEPFRKVLEYEERFYGAGSPGTAVALSNVVDCLVEARRGAEAWHYAERLEQILDAHELKPDVDAYARIMLARARLLRRQGTDVREARSLLREAHAELAELPARLERELIEETATAEGWSME